MPGPGQPGLGGIAGMDLEGAKFGFINMLRTGNPTYDMLIAMMVPLIFKFLVDLLMNSGQYLNRLTAYFKWGSKDHVRIIEYEEVRNNWGYSITSRDEKNNILLKAITLYLNEKKIKFKEAKVSLVSIHDQSRQYDDDNDDKEANTPAGQLSKYKLTLDPPVNIWIDIQDGLQFMQKQAEAEEGGENSKTKKKTVTYMIKSSKGEALVDKYISEVYDWYLGELRKLQDHSRYLYEMQVKSSGGGGEEGAPVDTNRQYKRYKLSDEKTFESLYFPEKESLLGILKHFTAKSGKYSIAGYPHKFGVLLHGPPGTGKTSLIKAIAHHTKRSIVNVPLARINTNQELMDIMFDQKYSVQGMEVPIKLGFKDVIFVMEDVDAASKIVHRRDGGTGFAKDMTDQITKQQADTVEEEGGEGGIPAAPGLNKRGSTDLSSSKSSDGGTEEAKGSEASSGDADAEKPTTTKKKKKKEAAAEESDGEDEEDANGGLSGDSAMMAAVMASLTDGGGKDGKMNGPWKPPSKSDKLDLSGLLNVLDGVVDTPERILVMTTNHPEKLDPALIRPGRIDKKLLLGYMAPKESCQMVAHYFQSKLPANLESRLMNAIEGDDSLRLPALNFTPAQLEQMCAEFETLETLVAHVEGLAMPQVDKLARKATSIVHVP